MKLHVPVLAIDGYDDGWPPTEAGEFIAWFVGKIETIPAEHRGEAKIFLDITQRYGESYPSIDIYYSRPETDYEIAAREAEERRRQEAHREHELRTLAALKAKYGS